MELRPSLLFVAHVHPNSLLKPLKFYPTISVAKFGKRAKAEGQPAALDPSVTPSCQHMTGVGAEDRGSQRAQRKNHW